MRSFMYRVRLLSLLLCFLAGTVWAQSDVGKLKGQIKDKESDEPLEFATVKVFLNGIEKGGMNSDLDGNYSFSALPPGNYEVVVSYSGKSNTFKNVIVSAGQTTVQNLFIGSGVTTEVVVIQEKLVKQDQTVTGITKSKEDLKNIGSRDLNAALATGAGTVQKDEGQAVVFRGARTSGQETFVDGVRVSGRLALPRAAIQEMSAITGGTPAEYGDAMGGIVSITTSAPSAVHTGSIEYVTSRVFDKYGYDLAAVSGSGPLLSKKDSTGKKTDVKLGYFAGVEFESQKDRSPSATGINVLDEDLMKSLNENPLQASDDGTYFINRANFLRASDIKNVKAKTDAGYMGIRANVRLDYMLNKNTYLKIGGSYDNTNQRSWSLTNSLLTSQANAQIKDNTMRGYIRFQQMFPGDSSSKIKNLFYNIQADYQRFYQVIQDKRFGDDLFKYGHIGSFTSTFQEFLGPVFPGDANHNPGISPAPYQATFGFFENNLAFDAANSNNPILANYNKNIYDYLRENPRFGSFNNVFSQTDLLILGGLRNGDGPGGIYSLYNAQGGIYGGYSKSNSEMYRLTGSATAEVGNHNLKLGFEFQQRSERYWGISPRGLWTLMRQQANKHLTTLDYDNPQAVYVDGVFQDIVHYGRKYEASNQSNFDKNLRSALGLPVDGTDLIQIDAIDPSKFNLNMFDASELLNGGASVVAYYGYDYLGNRTKSSNAGDFFSNFTGRPQNAYAPSYIAAYLQDKFEYDKMYFNIGLRVDRFDANQKVLKDKYVMRDFYNASEAAKLLNTELPSTVEGEWTPYVDNVSNPTRIIGYRNEDTWYDASGSPTNPSLLAGGSGKVSPYIKADSLSIDAFTDYTPQINVMPRVSFSFPISDEALFFAHYDVLTQRPSAAATGVFVDYLFINQNATEEIANPNLKPEKTIDYEVGFQQAIGTSMALSITAYYREMRDMIQSFRNNYAYPITYDSFENLDFATVKGFSAGVTTRRMGPVKLQANYTLQFASGTGSSFGSSRAALGSIEGFSVLRTLLPLSFDQRHTLAGNIDFRFTGAPGKNNKPLLGPGFGSDSSKVYPLKNFGVNLTFNLGSGTPYTRNSLPNSADVQFGINANNQVKGTPFGSRLPFNYRFDLRIDRDFIIGGKETEITEGENKGKITKSHEYSINVYLLILNVLGTKNINSVYTYSALPNDNGYLNTAVGQQTISSQIDQQSFVDLYRIRANAPGNYTLPRRFRVGVIFNF